MTESSHALLRVKDLCVSYGLGDVVSRVGFELGKGETLAILGPNGAGKSSLGRAIAGTLRPTAGRVVYNDSDIAGLSAYRVSRLGLAYLPEGRAIFRDLSVRDNLRMYLRGASRTEREDSVGKAIELFPVLGQRSRQRAGTLSGGEQQMLALARVLMRSPQLLIADEPSLGLAPKLVDMVFEALHVVRNQGVAIVLMEQYVRRALAFADQCVILQRGVTRWRGSSSEAGDEVLVHYLGEM
jgi:branched-chain amino acid transport system ATP-binding protein